MSMQHLKSLIDLISKPCISGTDVQQAIETAQPFPKQGMIIGAQTAPDVVSNPELAYFIWAKTNVSEQPIGELYYYNGSSWTLFALIDGSKLADHSVTLNKISLSGSSPYYIIQVDGTGANLVWVAINDAIQNGTLDIIKLKGIADANTYVTTCITGTVAFTLLNTFLTTTIPGNSLPIGKIAHGAANALRLWLSTKVDGSDTEWSVMDVANIAAAGYVAGQSIRRNAGNNGWEGYTPNTAPVVTLTNGGAYYTIPATNAATTIAHGQSSVPKIVRTVLINTTPVDGYSLNDEVDISCVTADQDGTNQLVAYAICTDATNITVAATSYATGINYVAKAGTEAAFDNSKWRIKVYLIV